MAKSKWSFLSQNQQVAQAQDVSKQLPVPVIASADAKKFGFENFGNTCYANSVLQALYFCAPFRDLILQSADPSFPHEFATPMPPPPHPPVRPKPERKQSVSGASDNPPNSRAPIPTIPADPPTLFSALRSLFFYISTHPAERGTVAPRAFINKLKEVNTSFDSTMHQDAHEFLNYLLNRIVEEVGEQSKDTAEDLSNSLVTESSNSGHSRQDATLVHRLFEGILTSETRCLTCETVSSRDESFLDLSIDIEQNSSVTACLRQFSASEMLCQRNKFFCDSCCDLQEAEKRMKIKKLPNVLALHLKRFKYQEDVQRYTKLTYRVAFPFELRLFNTVDDIDNADRLYNLFGIVVHIGNGPHHGHYVSVVKTLGVWLLFDDDNVTPVPENEIIKYFGDSPSGSAYVLYYQAADIDLPGLGLAQKIAQEMSEKASDIIRRDDNILETSRLVPISHAEEDVHMQDEEAHPALPPGLHTDNKLLNASDLSLEEPGTSSVSSASASAIGIANTSVNPSTGRGAPSSPLAMSIPSSLPGASATSPSNGATSHAGSGKMQTIMRVIRKSPSMSIKSGLSAVGLSSSVPPSYNNGQSSSTEEHQPLTNGPHDLEPRTSIAEEPSLTQREMSGSATSAGLPLENVLNTIKQTTVQATRTPLVRPFTAASSSTPTPKVAIPSRPLTAGKASVNMSTAMEKRDSTTDDLLSSLNQDDQGSEGGNRASSEWGKHPSAVNMSKSGEKDKRGDKKSNPATWFSAKRKSLKAATKETRVGEIAASILGDVSPPLDPSEIKHREKGDPQHQSSGVPPSSTHSHWFRTSMQRQRRPADVDIPEAPAYRENISAFSGSDPSSAFSLSSPSTASTTSPPPSQLQPTNYSSSQPNNTYQETNGMSSNVSHTSSFSPSMPSPPHPLPAPRMQLSISTPSPAPAYPTNSNYTQRSPENYYEPLIRTSSMNANQPLQKSGGSPERKKSSPALGNRDKSTYHGTVHPVTGKRPATSSGTTQRTSSSSPSKGVRPLPPVPPLPQVQRATHRRHAESGGSSASNIAFGPSDEQPTAPMRGIRNGNEDVQMQQPSSHAPPLSLHMQSPSPPPLSSNAAQSLSPPGLASSANASQSIAHSTAGMNIKRATRKLSITSPMLGFSKKTKEKDKTSPSSFTRF